MADIDLPALRALSLDERDADGNLTDTSLALDAIKNEGCDCGEDEPGTCLAHLCEAALKSERTARIDLMNEITALKAKLVEAREALARLDEVRRGR